MRIDRRFEDDREERRDLTGIAAGALVGGLLGAVVALVSGVGAVALVAVGGVLGAAAGKGVASRISHYEWDPRTSGRPHVGAKAPDDEA